MRSNGKSEVNPSSVEQKKRKKVEYPIVNMTNPSAEDKIMKHIALTVVLFVIGIGSLYGISNIAARADVNDAWEAEHAEQLEQTQERIQKRIVGDVEKVALDIRELAIPGDEIGPLLRTLEQVEEQAKAIAYPAKLKGFRAILPLNENHAKVFAAYSAILREKGHEGLALWHIDRFEHFDLFSIPGEKVSKISLEMMRNERRSQAVNLTNCTPEAQKVQVTLSGIPEEARMRVFHTVFVDTKRGLANPSALLPATKKEAVEEGCSAWTFGIPSGLTTQIWIMVDSEDAAAGAYEIPVRIESDGISQRLAFDLTIAPVQFPENPEYNLVMFDYAADAGRAVTPANQKAALSDLQEHLTSLYLVGRGAGPKITRADYDDQGNLTGTPNLASWKQTARMLPDSRYIGVFLNLEWDKKGLGFSFASFPAGSEAGRNALKQWVQYFEKACIDMGFDPRKVALIPFDEPRSNENFKAVYEAMKVIKENSRFTTYCTTGARGADNEYCAKSLEYTDISQPCRRHFLELSEEKKQMFLDFAKQPGKQLLFYDCGYKRGFKYYVAGGWQDVLMGGTGSGYWSYCDAGDNPSNWNMYPKFRRIRDNYAPQYIDEKSVTSSREWEGIAESVENGQYVLMLKQKINQMKAADKETSALEELLESRVPKTPAEAHDLRLKFLHALSR